MKVGWTSKKCLFDATETPSKGDDATYFIKSQSKSHKIFKRERIILKLCITYLNWGNINKS